MLQVTSTQLQQGLRTNFNLPCRVFNWPYTFYCLSFLSSAGFFINTKCLRQVTFLLQCGEFSAKLTAKVYTLFFLLETSLSVPLSLCNSIAEWTMRATMCCLKVQPYPQASPCAFFLFLVWNHCMFYSCHWDTVPGKAIMHILALLPAHMLPLSCTNAPNLVIHAVCDSG